MYTSVQQILVDEDKNCSSHCRLTAHMLVINVGICILGLKIISIIFNTFSLYKRAIEINIDIICVYVLTYILNPEKLLYLSVLSYDGVKLYVAVFHISFHH